MTLDELIEKLTEIKETHKGIGDVEVNVSGLRERGGIEQIDVDSSISSCPNCKCDCGNRVVYSITLETDL